VERRVAALQSAMQSNGIGVAWIEHLADRLYFSGSPQDGVLLMPSEGAPVFLVRKSLKRAEQEGSVAVEPYPGGGAVVERARILAGTAGTVGLGLDVSPAATYARLLGPGGVERIVDLSATVRAIRSVKSPWEIEQIRRAADQVTTLYAGIVEHLRPGITELELTGRVEGRLRSLGHGGTVRVRRPGSDISMGVVVSGTSALYPTSFNGPVGAEGPYPPTASGAGWKTLEAGETVMLDIVTSYNGYHADTTRTFFLGQTPPSEVLAAHDFCRGVLGDIEARLRPGGVCSTIYRDVLSGVAERGEPRGFMGFGENRVRFLGHGVGLELDEMPVLADRIDVTLEPGMVLAVEPKAFLEGIGPVGVENTYVVTASACEALCPTDLALRPVPG
jgi:Xaa-Pro aminopeptidase